MRKSCNLVLVFLTLLTLALAGCGGGSGGDAVSNGTLNPSEDSSGGTNPGTEPGTGPGTTVGPPSSISLDSNVPRGTLLSHGGEASIVATVKDSGGHLVDDGTLVTFTSSGGSISGSDSTVDGKAKATFQAGSKSGSVTITAYSGTATGQISLQVATGDASSIIKESVVPDTIGVFGSGIEDTSLITFNVRDAAGNPVQDGTKVNFSIGTGLNGGEKLTATAANTAGGVVSVSLQSGTVAGTVSVIATIDGASVSTMAQVTIISNRPDAGRITIGADTLNLAGGVTLGLQSTVQAYLGDRSGNVVPDGTPVSFISECGTIGESGGFKTSTQFGVASAVFQTSAPTVPAPGGLTPKGNPGLCRIVAYTPGKGTFLDKNGNGIFDPGTDTCTTKMDEPYIDANDSGAYEPGEYYVDINGNNKFDKDVVNCIDNSMIWTSMNLLISDYAKPLDIEPNGFNLSLGESQVFTLNLSDIWGNSLVAGTKVKITSDGGKIVGMSEYTVPDTTTPGQTLSFTLSSDMVPTDPKATSPSPEFVTVTATLEPAPGQNNNGAGFFDVATGMINLPVPEPATLSVFVSSDVPAGTQLAQGETSGVMALLRYSDGTLAPDGTTVAFTPSGGTLDPALTTTINGEASTTFTAPNSGGPVQIKASAQGGEGYTPIDVSNGQATTIVVNNITPKQIGVRGSGLGDSTIITFDVFDQAGNITPDGTEVNFALSSTTGGGEHLSTTKDQTFNGQVSVTLQSGVRAGTAAVTASIIAPDNSTITTVARVIIAAGLPDAKHFSLSAAPLNLPGYTWFGETSEVRAYPHRYSNPVPEGTPIFFESEAGAMAFTNVTTNNIGQALASHITQQPLPDTVSSVTGLKGVNKVLAWTAGSESFVDLNGNGSYDPGEPFEDIGEPFIDANDNGLYDQRRMSWKKNAMWMSTATENMIHPTASGTVKPTSGRI